MQEKPDAQLLREYAEQRNEAAFREIVARHADLVYSSALRQVASPDLARDVAQSVFADLARKAQPLARKLTAGASLLGWLYRSTRFATLNHLRDERRRRTRERQVMEHLDSAPETAPDWDRVRPVLDEAMADLSDEERDAVLLRFFKNHDFRRVGAALGVSDDTAQKRVSRALERLRGFFSKRGVTIGAGGLGAVISANAVPAAPAGLAAAFASASLAAVPAGTGTTLALLKMATMTKLQASIISAVIVAGVTTPLVIQHQAQVKLREENSSLRQQIAQLQTDNENLSSRAGQAGSPTLKLPVPRVRAAIAPTQPPAEELQITNLSARLKDYSAKLTSAQVASYLNAHRRSAASLLAAYRATGDSALLEEAKENHPDDPQVAFEAAFRKDAPPEERRQWLNAFKQSAPENALPNYLSALDYFKAGQFDQAVQELAAASGKQQFQDYTLDRLQDDEEVYLGAGHTVAEAKTIPAQQLLLPQLAQLKELSQHMMELSKSYQQAGDAASARAALQMAAQLGQRYGGTVPGEPTISQLVGIAVERIALNAMEPGSPYGDGQTVKERLDQLAKQRAQVEERARQMDALQSRMTDQDWITYKDRWRVFGEDAAAKWLIGKYGQK